MKVTLHLNLKSCHDCPYKRWSDFSGQHKCAHPKILGIVPCKDEGFPADCPFLPKKEEEDEAAIAMRESLGENWW